MGIFYEHVSDIEYMRQFYTLICNFMMFCINILYYNNIGLYLTAFAPKGSVTNNLWLSVAYVTVDLFLSHILCQCLWVRCWLLSKFNVRCRSAPVCPLIPRPAWCRFAYEMWCFHGKVEEYKRGTETCPTFHSFYSHCTDQSKPYDKVAHECVEKDILPMKCGKGRVKMCK